MVLPSQERVDRFVAIQKQGEAEDKKRKAYEKIVDEVMRKYWAGELVERPKASQPAPMARESAPAAQ